MGAQQAENFCPGLTDQLVLKQDNSYNLVVKHVKDAGSNKQDIAFAMYPYTHDAGTK